MKARFTTEQPAVSWQPLDNGMVDVTICLNGQEVTEENQQMMEKEQYTTVTETFWEYDFHQFREKAENVNREAVEKNPEKYLDELRRMVSERCTFATDGSFIKPCFFKHESSAVGAALYFVDKFIEEI